MCVVGVLMTVLLTGVWTQLDPVADLKDPVAAVGPPVMCSGVSSRDRLACPCATLYYRDAPSCAAYVLDAIDR
jgi:hypothetical protein